MEVFNAWELEKLIGEDGKRPANIPKPPRLDNTMNDVDRTIGLQDSELLLLTAGLSTGRTEIRDRASVPVRPVDLWDVR